MRARIDVRCAEPLPVNPCRFRLTVEESLRTVTRIWRGDLTWRDAHAGPGLPVPRADAGSTAR